MGMKERTVGERGQVTIPKELRERFGIEGGDEVVVRERDGTIVIETLVSREELAEGYRRRSERDAAIDAELDGVAREANEHLGEPPEWE
jgi:AbrB family looped-hinge helix DNA binding protein